MPINRLNPVYPSNFSSFSFLNCNKITRCFKSIVQKSGTLLSKNKILCSVVVLVSSAILLAIFRSYLKVDIKENQSIIRSNHATYLSRIQPALKKLPPCNSARTIYVSFYDPDGTSTFLWFSSDGNFNQDAEDYKTNYTSSLLIAISLNKEKAISNDAFQSLCTGGDDTILKKICDDSSDDSFPGNYLALTWAEWQEMERTGRGPQRMINMFNDNEFPNPF